MCTITFPDGSTNNYECYNEFKCCFDIVCSMAHDNKETISWLSYYDRLGDTHKVIYLLKTVKLSDGRFVDTLTIDGQEIIRTTSTSLHDAAAKYVRLAFSDFVGWSI